MKKILLIVSILISIIGIYDFYKSSQSPSYAKSFGSLTVNFHSSLPGNAVFNINNFLPGQSINKNIDVKNDGNETMEVFVKGIKRSGNGNPKLENVLDLKITQGSSILYSKKLNNFLDGDKISLGKINKNQSKTYNFRVTFESSAGNTYQGKSVKFDVDFSSGEVKGANDNNNGDDNHEDNDNHGKFDYKKFDRFFKFVESRFTSYKDR
jgi:hypothetical protein